MRPQDRQALQVYDTQPLETGGAYVAEISDSDDEGELYGVDTNLPFVDPESVYDWPTELPEDSKNNDNDNKFALAVHLAALCAAGESYEFLSELRPDADEE